MTKPEKPFSSLFNEPTRVPIGTGRRHLAPPGECAFCDRMRAEGADFFPDHDASSRCQSGAHDHCTCDTCF